MNVLTRDRSRRECHNELCVCDDRRKVLTRKFQIIFYLTITCPQENVTFDHGDYKSIFVHNCTFFFSFFCQKKKKHATCADETMMANIKGVNKYRPEKELLQIAFLILSCLLLYICTPEIASLRTFQIQFLYSMVKRLRDSVGRCPR